MILSGYTSLEEAAITGKDTFRARIISPGWGSSGYYSPDTLKEASHLYKAGLKMYLNHPTVTERKELPEKDVSKIVGYLATNGVYESGPHPGIYAHVKILPKYLDLVQHAGKILGLSHYAFGEGKTGTAEGRRGNIVEKISSVLSVDIVSNPGRGGRICESGRYILPTGDETSQSYFESLVESGMSPKAASVVITRMTGTVFAPAPGTTNEPLTESTSMLIDSYVSGGMSLKAAKMIVLRGF